MRPVAGLVYCLACTCIAAGAPAPAAATGPVEPRLEIRETRQEYLVSARDEAELFRRLRVGGDEMGHARGLTEGRLTITRNLTQTADACIVNEVTIELEITTTVPAWNPVEKIPSKLERRWKSLSTMVYAHENRHRAHLIDAAFAMREAIATMIPKARCMLVELQLQRIVDREDMKRKLADQLLDRQRLLPR